MDSNQIDQIEEAAIEAESVLGVLQLIEAAILNLGDDRGMTVGRVIDARELLRSSLFERMGDRDRRLVVRLVAAS